MLTASRFFLASLALAALTCVVLADDDSSALFVAFDESDAALVESQLASEAAANGGSFGSATNNYQGALALSLLSSANLAKNKASLCKAAGKDLATAVSSAGNIDLALASEALKLSHLLSCDSSSVKDSDVDAAVTAAKADLTASSPTGLYHAVSVLASTKSAKVDASDVSGILQAVVDFQKEDGSFGSENEEGTLDNAGHALQTIKLAAGLSKPLSSDWDAVSQVTDKANNLVDKLMESDDASIAATVQIFDGLNYLATTPAGDKVSIAAENVVLLAENIIASKSAPATSEAGFVVHGLQLLANNKFSVVPVVTVLTKSISAAAKGQDAIIKVRVTDILGKSLGKTTVHLNQASLGDAAVAQNVALAASKGSDTVFELNLAAAAQKIEQGTYTLDLKISPKDSRAVAEPQVKRTVRVTTSASISGLEVSIQDAKSGNGKQHSAEYPKTFGELAADYLQAIEFSFTVRSQVSSKTFHPHQAFVRFSNKDFEAIFVTRVVDRKQRVKVVVADAAAEAFKNRGGVYDVEIIVGDTHMDDAIVWQVGKISLTFADDPAPAKPAVKPELHHTFRAAEKRPLAIVSLFFTGLILASFLVLLSLISRLNIGLRLPSGDKFLPTAAFHIIIGLILALYVLYWLKLNMFECLTFLAPLSAAALVVGSKVLS